MRRAKSLRNGVHHANAVVWEPVYRTRLFPQRRGVRRVRLLHLVDDALPVRLSRDSLLFQPLESRRELRGDERL